MNITLDRVWPGHPVKVSGGQTVAISLPAGWALMCSPGYADWFAVSSPFIPPHDCFVRVDCLESDGTPVTATLTIT